MRAVGVCSAPLALLPTPPSTLLLLFISRGLQHEPGPAQGSVLLKGDFRPCGCCLFGGQELLCKAGGESQFIPETAGAVIKIRIRRKITKLNFVTMFVVHEETSCGKANNRICALLYRGVER